MAYFREGVSSHLFAMDIVNLQFFVVVVTLFQFQKLQIFQIWQQTQTNKFVSVSPLLPNEMPVSMLIIHMQLISAMVSIS